MFCTNCGAELSVKSRFCSECGDSIIHSGPPHTTSEEPNFSPEVTASTESEVDENRSEPTNNQSSLEGIGGWLILVAIGIVITPIRILTVIQQTYDEVIASEVWPILTSPESAAYDPLWAPLIYGEILVNSFVFCAYIYMGYLFFTKNHNFPKWFIGIALFGLAFIIIDAFAFKTMLPNEPMFDAATTKEVMRSVFLVIIWIPYILFSKRVKATFRKVNA